MESEDSIPVILFQSEHDHLVSKREQVRFILKFEPKLEIHMQSLCGYLGQDMRYGEQMRRFKRISWNDLPVFIGTKNKTDKGRIYGKNQGKNNINGECVIKAPTQEVIKKSIKS